MAGIFKGLRPFQLTEYIFLILFAAFVPISWRMSTYAMIGLAVSCILKGIFEDGFKINQLQYKNKIIYFLFIAFWVLYAISFLYSNDTVEARIQIGKKLTFFLFPLFFLCSNLSYLTKDRVRIIMYCFVSGILIFYAIHFLWAIYDISFNDVKNTRITSYHEFFKSSDIFEKPHRAYFSMFTCFGLAFCFAEFFTQKSVKVKIFNFIALIILAFSPFYVMSRAGILCLGLIFFLLWIWLMFFKKDIKLGITIGIYIVTILITSYFAFPKSIDRFTDAVDNVKEGKGDIRLTIRKGCRYAMKGNFFFGVGAGDRNYETLDAYRRYRKDVISMIQPSIEADMTLFEQNRKKLLDSIDIKYENKYSKDVYEYAESISDDLDCDYNSVKENLSEYQIIDHLIKTDCNAHNQFTDTRIAVGILGFILLLSFFFTPIYLWIKNKKFDIVLFSLLFIIAFNSLFESVLERQMGIMFFVFFYFLFFHVNFCQGEQSVISSTNDKNE